MTKLILILSVLNLSAWATSPSETKETLWTQWYLYTAAGVPQGYYEETFEKRKKDNHLAVSQRWVEKDNGRTETFIGSVAIDNQKLTPVAFFSERNGPTKIYKIDGRVKGKKLDMTFKPELPKGPNIKKSTLVGPSTLLANFVPLYVAKKMASSPESSFDAVVEDARDGNFDIRKGSAKALGVTKQVGNFSCRKVVIEFAGVVADWWIANNGMLCEILIPQNGSKLTLTTEAEAKKALGM